MPKKPKKYYLTYLYTFNHDIVIWLTVLFVRLFWGTKLHFMEGLWCEIKKDKLLWWQDRIAGIVLGHGGIYKYLTTGQEGLDTGTESHEHVHVEQYEGVMLHAFLSGLVIFLVSYFCGPFIPGLFIGWAIWQLGWPLYIISNSIQAWIRGEDLYWGATHEESARALSRQFLMFRPHKKTIVEDCNFNK